MPHVDRVVIDTETTGLGAGARMVEVACLVLDAAGQTKDRWETLVDVGRKLGSTDIHGIDSAMLVAAPPFSDVASTIEHLIRDRIPVGHNLAFDWAIMRREFRRLGVEVPPSHGGICTADLGEQLLGRRPSLGEICRCFGIERRRAHTAAGDADATARALLAMVRAGMAMPPGRPCPAFGRAWRLPRPADPLPRTRAAVQRGGGGTAR